MRSSHALRDIERWIAWIRLGAVPFAIFQVALSSGYPAGYEAAAWAATATLAAGGLPILLLPRGELSERAQVRVGALALAFDTAIIAAFVLLYSWESSTPTRQLFYLPLAEAAVRYAIAGALGLALVSAPVLAVFEELRANRNGGAYHVDYVTFQVGVEILMALILGWLVRRPRAQTEPAGSRAGGGQTL